MSDLGSSKLVLDLCGEALALSEKERDAFVRTACQGDPELLAAVESLLRSVDDSGSFLTLDLEDVE